MIVDERRGRASAISDRLRLLADDAERICRGDPYIRIEIGAYRTLAALCRDLSDVVLSLVTELSPENESRTELANRLQTGTFAVDDWHNGTGYKPKT